MTESHIVQMPKGFLVLRILQIVFALIVTGLTAFLISNTIGFVFSATAFGIFCGILTLIIVTYDLVSERAAKQAYNMWAVLSLEIVMVLFWLSAMGSMAALRAAFTVDVVLYKRQLQKRYYYTWAGDTYLAILAAAAGVAAIEWILFIVSLVMFSIRLHKHRTGRASAGPNVENVHVTPEKLEMQPQATQGQYYGTATPQQTYPNYQPPAMQAQHTSPAQTFSPVSPVQTGQAPYQPTMSPAPSHMYPTPTTSPPPQFPMPAPQYPVTSPPQGYHEVSGQH